jgi:tetratricopeptide (TPR) repeat protein
MDCFREAAERYGYIVASSYNTRSDGPFAQAMNGVHILRRDTHRRFAIDGRRVYMAGFSGEARLACRMADTAPGSVTGVIACGAGFPLDRPPHEGLTFAFFGIAGTTDFNHDEVVGLDRKLDSLKATHRIETFDGGHEWPSSELCTQALEWMEILAMKEGSRPRDEALVDNLLANGLREAEASEESGQVYAAYHRYAALARDFKGLRDVSDLEKRADNLQESKELKDYVKRRDRQAEKDKDYLAKAPQALVRFPPDNVRSLPRALNFLKISSLKKRAKKTDDPIESLSAQRLLESVFVQTAYYVPSDLFNRGDYERAVLSLSIAAEIKPENPFVWYNLSRAYARMDRKQSALESLERAVDTGFSSVEELKNESDFASLREDDGFVSIVKRLEAAK